MQLRWHRFFKIRGKALYEMLCLGWFFHVIAYLAFYCIGLPYSNSVEAVVVSLGMIIGWKIAWRESASRVVWKTPVPVRMWLHDA